MGQNQIGGKRKEWVFYDCEVFTSPYAPTYGEPIIDWVRMYFKNGGKGYMYIDYNVSDSVVVNHGGYNVFIANGPKETGRMEYEVSKRSLERCGFDKLIEQYEPMAKIYM